MGQCNHKCHRQALLISSIEQQALHCMPFAFHPLHCFVLHMNAKMNLLYWRWQPPSFHQYNTISSIRRGIRIGLIRNLKGFCRTIVLYFSYASLPPLLHRSREAPPGCDLCLVLVVDKPPATISRQQHDWLQQLQTTWMHRVRVRMNHANLGASATRNRALQVRRS